ncbi:Superfamily II DNA or RNA helicase, SNF2 family [Lachnospiraceae bacterium C7]|nr:Superfamily II DNA or RNA helicase, SNF2 family [Lachnospiraceae bacterium C7]
MSNNAKRERIYPFKDNIVIDAKEIYNIDNYSYFDMNRITARVYIYEENYKLALDMLERNEIKLDKVDFGYTLYGNKKLQGNVLATFSRGLSKGKVKIEFSRLSIISIFCKGQGYDHVYDASSLYGDGTLVAPEIATLILLNDYIKKYKPGDATDSNALSLMDEVRKKTLSNFSQKAVGELSEKQMVVEFVPKLTSEYGQQINVTFRFGMKSGKKYVIKNLFSFYKCYENKTEMKFGKSTIINFKYVRFTEQSKKILKFIKKYVKDNYASANSTEFGYISVPAGKIDLEGSYLDDFFEIYNGETIDFKEEGNYSIESNKKSDKIILEDVDLNIDLDIKPIMNKGNFDGVLVEGILPKIKSGINYGYFITENCFARIDQAVSDRYAPLTKITDSESRVSFEVGRRNISEFFRETLQAIGANVHMDEETTQLVERYMPPEVEFKFYLDAEDGNIVCDAKACYGDVIYSLSDIPLNKTPMDAIREKTREEYINSQLMTLFVGVNEETGFYDCFNNEDKSFNIMEGGLSILMDLGEVHVTDRLQNIKVKSRLTLMMGVSIRGDLLNIEIMSDDVKRDELLEILNSYRLKKRYHKLKNGDYIDLRDENIASLSQFVDTLQITEEELREGAVSVPMYRALYLDKMLEENDGIYTKRDQHFKKLIKEFKAIKDSDFELPESLDKIMRKYQKVGYRWLRTLEQYGFGGILADDMGLGKTLQAISVLLSAKEENRLGCSLIVTPASLIYNWQEEINRFAPTIKVGIITGTKNERKDTLEKCYKECDVIVTSYDLLKRDITFYEDKQFAYQFIDEAQYIKNHSTAAAKSVKVIKSRTRFALTGTPIENRLSELWSIFDYLMPGFLYDYESFRTELEYPITKGSDEDASSRLRRMVSPFILRRLKTEVLKDLPDKIEEISYASFEKEQRRVYDGQVVKIKNMLDGQTTSEYNKNKIQLLAELTTMREICCDPRLVFSDYKGASAKTQNCMELVENAIEGGHRCLIFSQFTSMLALLEEQLKKEKIEYYKIVGQTSKENRAKYVKEFNSNKVPVFLISLKAGGTGLNLTGADVVIHFDPWWNLAVQNQATDRAYRIGQTRAVSVYKLIAKDTIEEKIVKLQEKKKDLSDAILSGENGNISSLSKEELLELLS